NDPDGALSLADEAVAIIGMTDYPNWQGEAHEIRGVVLLAADRVAAASAAFSEALMRYESKGTVVWADRTRSRLEALKP
ncbi:MAG: hypothetical protein WBM72_07430, partial [Actinomycetota bacterium]